MSDPQLSIGKIKWLCRRGWKEHDVLCERFMAEEYDQCTPDEQAAFVRLLQLDDPDFSAVVLGKVPPPDDGIGALLPKVVMPSKAR